MRHSPQKLSRSFAGKPGLIVRMNFPSVKIELPAWIESFTDLDRPYASDEEKMRLAIGLARENVLQKTGGPFGAAIFERESGKILSVGINLVTTLNNSCLHAETVAVMTAQAILSSYSLNAPGLPKYELFSSCEPCCMCLGATLWSGVARLVCGATKADAIAVGFDEGPVYESSYEYLQNRGIAVERRILNAEAIKVFDLYQETGGLIYNR